MMEHARSRLPVLDSLARESAPRRAARSFLVTHVLGTSVPYLDILHRIFPIEAVLAIPYSAEKNAVDEIRAGGIEVIAPATIADAHRAAGDTLQRLLGRSSAPLVAQEVGGYLASFSGELARYPHFVGVVEDTNNGHWRYEVTVPHAFPILSIARSPLKDIEDTLIGDAVAFSLERILRENFCAVIQGCHVGVLGYGKIGTSTAIAMRGRESAVSVHDLSPIRTIRAKVQVLFGGA